MEITLKVPEEIVRLAEKAGVSVDSDYQKRRMLQSLLHEIENASSRKAVEKATDRARRKIRDEFDEARKLISPPKPIVRPGTVSREIDI